MKDVWSTNHAGPHPIFLIIVHLHQFRNPHPDVSISMIAITGFTDAELPVDEKSLRPAVRTRSSVSMTRGWKPAQVRDQEEDDEEGKEMGRQRIGFAELP